MCHHQNKLFYDVRWQFSTLPVESTKHCGAHQRDFYDPVRLQSRTILRLCARSKDEVHVRLADYSSYWLFDPLQLSDHLLLVHCQYCPCVQA